MPIYKIYYLKECEHIMEVEAVSEEEAKKKFERFECITDEEFACLNEEIIKIQK